MSSEREPEREHDEPGEVTEQTDAVAPVTVRRNVAWAAPVAVLASALAIAYVWRATSTGSVLDWVLCVFTTVVAGIHLTGLLDARTALLVADEPGVRVRLGSQWRGLPWEAVEQVVVEPRKGRLRDGRLLVVPHNLGRVLDGLDARGRRQAKLNQKLYGAALAVPLGLVTRVSATGEQEIADRVAALSLGRADVVTLIETEHEHPLVDGVVDTVVEESLVVRRSLGALVSKVAGKHVREVPPDSEPTITPLAPAATAIPLRDRIRGLRPDLVTSSLALDLDLADDDIETVRRLPEERHLRRPGVVDLIFEPEPESNVRPIATVGDVVAPLVIDDFETQPAYDPVIGPELVAARHRVGLSVDEVADRTRIRPHVIESIEVDDFAPCGGDVYARGHIRTLARVLGQDPEPLLRSFDNRYANAPISARRVFEAELATGMTGSMRSTIGGPNWNLLIGFVLTLVLVWGVVRLFAGAPNEMVEQPPPLPDSAAWPSKVYDLPKDTTPAVPTVRLQLVALNASTRVQVTNTTGNVLFDQRLVYGEKRTLRVSLPIRLSADNGGALSVVVGKQDYGLLGDADKPAVRDFGPDAAG